MDARNATLPVEAFEPMTSAMARILTLLESNAAAAPVERRHAEMGLDRRIDGLKGAKAAFDEAMGRRFGNSVRN